MADLRIGLVGYKFMGKAHSHAYRDVGMFFDLPARPVMRALCGRNADEVAAAARKFGWQEVETNWRRLIQREDIDVVDISTPGHTHKEIAIAAADAGKHVMCEKPLANTLAEAEEMTKAVERAGVKHLVGFNYRQLPAVQLARRMLDQKLLGDIHHFRAVYLQDWLVDREAPLAWRLRKETAGSGPLGDLGAHIVDLARFLVGEVVDVTALTETFVRERPTVPDDPGVPTSATDGAMGEVTVEDAALFLTRFASGALGSFEATRFAAGRRNYNAYEINGSRGSIAFNLERLNELQYFNRDDPEAAQGFRTILVTDPAHPYAEAWWPPGHTLGWEHTFVHQVKHFVEAIARDEPTAPSFVDGLQCQSVLESVLQSAETGRSVAVRNFVD